MASRKRRSLRAWIPQYHGGWAMVIVPPLLGMVEGSFGFAQLVLFAFWMVGYFLFYSATLWLRSRMKARYFPPVRAYGIVVALLGLAVLLLAPYLLRWVPAFAPLVAIAGWEAWKRRDRSLLSGLSTIAAACLLVPVMYDLSVAGTPGFSASTRVWAVTALLFGYFAGTVFYVKTNIRERGSRWFLVLSVGWHLVWTLVAAVLAARVGILGCSDDAGTFCSAINLSSWHVFTWVLITARSVWVPSRGLAGKPVGVKAIGIGEVVTCALFVASLYV